MTTMTLVTSVYLSKAEALEILSDTLGVAWITDDPGDVTLALAEGVILTIEVPHYGEELPLTLDCHHDNAETLATIVANVQTTLETQLGWGVTPLT